MNLYDFDKTIYNGESGTKFYRFMLLRHPYLFWHIFVVSFWGLMKVLHIASVKRFKEKALSIVRFSKNISTDLENFWNKEEKNIFDYYLKNKKDNDVICSASPKFLIAPIIERINPTATLICSNINSKNGKFYDGEQNCKGQTKVERLKKQGFSHFENGYSDSLSDKPMLLLCDRAYLVKKGKITPLDKK